jgi:NaMN:DMB phosphoribosyltransferase
MVSPAARLAALQGTLKPKVCGARLLLFAADHGITKTVPGVSAYPRTVTPAMFGAIARGQAASSVLAAANGCSVILTDVGVDGDLSSIKGQLPATVLHAKVSWGPDLHGVRAGSMCLCVSTLLLRLATCITLVVTAVLKILELSQQHDPTVKKELGFWHSWHSCFSQLL